MEESDREIRVGKNRIYLDDDNILYITIVGELNEKIALEVKEVISKLEDVPGRKRNIIVDINKAGKISSDARKIFKELIEDGKTERIAIFGAHPVARVIAAFGIGLSQKKDLRFFKTKEEALAWLNEVE